MAQHAPSFVLEPAVASGRADRPDDVKRLTRAIEASGTQTCVLATPLGSPTRACVFVGGLAHSALELVDGTARPLALPDFFEPFRDGADADFGLHASSSLAALALGALARLEPTTEMPTSLVDTDALLAELERDVVTGLAVVRRGGELAASFVRSGRIARTLSRDGGHVDGKPARDAFVTSVNAHDDATLYLFENLHMKPAPLGGLELARYLEDRLQPFPISLQLSLEGRPISRRVHREGRLVVGRSGECDVSVDHPSVSRQHLAIEWSANHWRVEDLASLDGIALGDTKVSTAMLRAGDVISFGKAKLLVDEPAAELTRTIRFAATEATSGSVAPHVVRDERAVRVNRPVFSLGGSTTCNFVVPAWPDEVGVIVQEGDGYTLNFAPLAERVAVNGSAPDSRSVALRSGDVIEVGSARALFVMMEPAPPPESRGDGVDLNAVLRWYLDSV